MDTAASGDAVGATRASDFRILQVVGLSFWKPAVSENESASIDVDAPSVRVYSFWPRCQRKILSPPSCGEHDWQLACHRQMLRCTDEDSQEYGDQED